MNTGIWRRYQREMAQAMFALMLLAAVAPVVSRVLVFGHAAPSAAGAQWAELCTGSGVHWVRLLDEVKSEGVQAKAARSDRSSDDSPSTALDACPLCTLPMDRTLPVVLPAPTALEYAHAPPKGRAMALAPLISMEVAHARGPPLPPA